MKVCEMFYSIQGEGLTTGKTAFFIRLSGCNLTCSFCDSKYSWGEGTEMTVEQIAEAAKPYAHIVITGGEPLTQRTELYRLLKLLENKYIEVETNGSLKPCQGTLLRVDQFNISIKLSNSGIPKEQRIVPEVIEYYINYSLPHCWFKFVVTDEESVKEIEEIVTQFKIPASHVVLMPEGKTHEEISSKAPFVVDMCKRYGFRYSTRLHIDIWGNKKGV